MTDRVMEPSGSASMATMSVPTMPSVQNIIPMLSAMADIQSVPRSPAVASAAAAVAMVATTNTNAHEEPDIKRQKLDGTAKVCIPQINEKLESRLGGILCCAVCLDLPKMAMYQVGAIIR